MFVCLFGLAMGTLVPSTGKFDYHEFDRYIDHSYDKLQKFSFFAGELLRIMKSNQ